MTAHIQPAIRLFAILSLLTGVIYPMLVTGLAQWWFPEQAKGSLIRDAHGNAVGSELIGQPFGDPKYFWGRPSSTSPYPYNAAASGGSNLGPTNPQLAEVLHARIRALRAADPKNLAPVPADLVTSSASGLDPHISPASAAFQARRVAQARHVDMKTVTDLIASNTDGRQFGWLGEPRVHVLRLNRALDTLH